MADVGRTRTPATMFDFQKWTTAPPFKGQRDGQSTVTIAPCHNGVVFAGASVRFEHVTYDCQGLITYNGGAALAYLVPSIGHQARASTLTSLWAKASKTAMAGNAVFPRHLLPPIEDMESADRAQWAYSCLKQTLMNLKPRYGAQQRPRNVYKLGSFLPGYTKAFGFPGRSSGKVRYDLKTDDTKKWDTVLGARWDLVVDNNYIVTCMTFKKKILEDSFG